MKSSTFCKVFRETSRPGTDSVCGINLLNRFILFISYGATAAVKSPDHRTEDSHSDEVKQIIDIQFFHFFWTWLPY